jgi:hypothetical protein
MQAFGVDINYRFLLMMPYILTIIVGGFEEGTEEHAAALKPCPGRKCLIDLRIPADSRSGMPGSEGQLRERAEEHSHPSLKECANQISSEEW